MRCEFSSQFLGNVGVVGLLQVRCRRYDTTVLGLSFGQLPPQQLTLGYGHVLTLSAGFTISLWCCIAPVQVQIRSRQGFSGIWDQVSGLVLNLEGIYTYIERDGTGEGGIQLFSSNVSPNFISARFLLRLRNILGHVLLNSLETGTQHMTYTGRLLTPRLIPISLGL